jgi:hypothetical protein
MVRRCCSRPAARPSRKGKWAPIDTQLSYDGPVQKPPRIICLFLTPAGPDLAPLLARWRRESPDQTCCTERAHHRGTVHRPAAQPGHVRRASTCTRCSLASCSAPAPAPGRAIHPSNSSVHACPVRFTLPPATARGRYANKPCVTESKRPFLTRCQPSISVAAFPRTYDARSRMNSGHACRHGWTLSLRMCMTSGLRASVRVDGGEVRRDKRQSPISPCAS